MRRRYGSSKFNMKPRQFLIFLALSLALCSPSFSQTKSAPKDPFQKWEAEIKQFEMADRTNPPPAAPLLFIGSSSVRMWKTVATDFPEHKVINRGFGGSQIFEINHFFDRIVKPYQPRTIVFYAGDNDLMHKTPEEMAGDFKTFANLTHSTFPKTHILFLSVKPSVARWKNKGNIVTANRLVKEFAATTDYIHYIDIFTPMLDAKGEPRPELYLKDGLHMQRAGYEIWVGAVKPVLNQLK